MKGLPYTTKTGIRIGERYEPPLRSDYTHEERFAQDLLIGSPAFTFEEKVRFILYCVCVVLVVFLLSALGVK